MSLHIDVRKIPNYEKFCLAPDPCPEGWPYGGLSQKAYVLGFYMGLFIGVSECTPKTLPTIWARISRLQDLGLYIVNGVELSEEDIKQHTWISVNASERTNKQFEAFVGRMAVAELQRLRTRMKRDGLVLAKTEYTVRVPDEGTWFFLAFGKIHWTHSPTEAQSFATREEAASHFTEAELDNLEIEPRLVEVPW